MKYVEWCDLFLIGHPNIDKQHQKLFEIANKFHNEVYKGFNKSLTMETMNKLISYAQEHFLAEEKITADLGLPDELLESHKKIHEQLIMDVFLLNEKITDGQITSMYEIEKFLTEWLVLHILIEDKKYKKHLI